MGETFRKKSERVKYIAIPDHIRDFPLIHPPAPPRPGTNEPAWNKYNKPVFALPKRYSM